MNMLLIYIKVIEAGAPQSSVLRPILSFFLWEPLKFGLGLLFLKFSWFLGYTVLNLFLFSPDFYEIFHNIVIIYNTRNWSNDTTESQKEKIKTCFNAHAEEKWNLTVQCIVGKQMRSGHL